MKQRAPTLWLALTATLVALALQIGCRSEETQRCLDSFKASQAIVDAMDSRSVESVEKGLKSIDEANFACKLAKRWGESEQLEKAKREIKAHLDYLKRPRLETKKRSPEELARLEKKGDPSCPRGMAYKPAGSKKEIRCTGPLPINMNWSKAKAYFEGRDYKVRTGDSPNVLRIEYGAELLFFHYDKANSKRPPECVVLYPPPGMSFQEAVARTTGANPARIKAFDEIKTARGNLQLVVEEGKDKLIVRLGQCPK